MILVYGDPSNGTHSNPRIDLNAVRVIISDLVVSAAFCLWWMHQDFSPFYVFRARSVARLKTKILSHNWEMQKETLRSDFKAAVSNEPMGI